MKQRSLKVWLGCLRGKLQLKKNLIRHHQLKWCRDTFIQVLLALKHRVATSKDAKDRLTFITALYSRKLTIKAVQIMSQYAVYRNFKKQRQQTADELRTKCLYRRIIVGLKGQTIKRKELESAKL